VKDLGVATRETIPLSEWEALRGVGLGELHPEYKKVFKQIAFVKDPVSTYLHPRHDFCSRY
jgi:lactoylglutathione lyase